MKILFLILISFVGTSCVVQTGSSTGHSSSGVSSKLTSADIELLLMTKKKIVEQTSRSWPGKTSHDWRRDSYRCGDLLMDLHAGLLMKTRGENALGGNGRKSDFRNEVQSYYENQVKWYEEDMRNDPMAPGIGGSAEISATSDRLNYINKMIVLEVKNHYVGPSFSSWVARWGAL